MTPLLKVGVTGASGMLGTAILDHFAGCYTLLATSRSKGFSQKGITWDLFDLLDKKKLTEWLMQYQPDVVIHCAAMVNVDACEKEVAKAETLHGETAEIISNIISVWNGRLIYISTDAVFNGQREGFYTEEDQPNPLNVYGRTKHAGEIATLAASNNIVLRTSIFGWSQAEGRYSFAEWILKGLVEKAPLRMFTDVSFTPIHVSHVAKIIDIILTTQPNLHGLFHLTGNSKLSKHDFSLKMACEFGLSIDNIVRVNIDNAGLAAARPKNMALSNQKIAVVLGVDLPTVEQGVACLKSQYDNGYLARIKGRAMDSDYQFWRVV